MQVYQPHSAQRAVYAAIRRSIITLNLAPGASISEKEISLKYNVSRTPVREAFIHLADEGLVQVIPQKETLVSRIDFERVKQELFLRDTLETAVLPLFAAQCNPAHFAALEAGIALQAEALGAGNFVEFFNHDNAFHRVFFDGARMLLSWEIIESRCGHYYRARLLTTLLTDIAAAILEQHKLIVSALKEGDAERARSLLRAHLHKLEREEAALRREFPEYCAAPTVPNLPLV